MGGAIGSRIARLIGYDGRMRFTLRDVFAVTFLVALVAGVCRLAEHWHNQLAWLLMLCGELVSLLAILTLIVGAREQKVRDDERRQKLGELDPLPKIPPT